MAWSSNFISRLSSESVVPQYRLHFLDLNNCPGSDFNIYSTGSAVLHIEASGPIVNGSRVIPQSWTVSFGGFSVPIVGDIRESLASIKKGQFAELLCSLGGAYQRIAMGQLRAITGGPINWQFEFSDMLSALQNSHDARQNVSVGGDNIELYSPFFYMTGMSTAATAWDSGLSRLYVSNVLIFKRESGQNGIAKLVDGGVSKYYTFSSGTLTSSPAGYLTIVTQDAYPTTDTGSLAPASSTVYAVAKLQGYPGDILSKIILNGTSGTFGTYPDDWGAGGDFNGLIDFDDIWSIP